ncbi:FAD-dependent oxidoreductase [Umezawaea tangerina]|uniref:2-polyprenyl-6-methoxyphenol hydroxylase-like FAD-dependent oxidoreductase n=1 Tax=Umezawaea tangerina TaxID=84725 RepID=A0A2T0T047_9PSEU|nr:NAD(P)/FAD-dependent oxidoreductase [Umezawaea tangerina]PRY39014.1 2-polyprenyl-6-methoxyphenol hydroxylase-like FAD-dependent oxidoreductase [Umezawaea tangerina]
MSILKVLVVGAGLGGLTLAQSLRGHGIDVALFERDPDPWDRPQGYRLHLDADARNAAREVLSDDLWAVFEATSYRTETFTTILGTDLSVIKRIPTADELDDRVWRSRVTGHANVDRATLRQILLHGLDDVVHFGKTLDRYDDTGDGVTAYFTDGTTAHGDVLVGADGIRSAVRRQRAPHADTVDAGITAIYGRIPLDVATSLVPKEVITDVFTISSDDRKVFLGLGAVLFPTRPTEAATAHAPGLAMREQDDYVVAIVGGRHQYFPTLGAQVHSPRELQHVAADALAAWPSVAADVVRAGDPDSFFPVAMYTSVPCTLDAPSRVTLLGDAIHAMTPTLGRGANVAMRDGALLGRALAAVWEGRTELPTALAAYEHDMLAYGFAVVTAAARTGQQRMAQNPLPV